MNIRMQSTKEAVLYAGSDCPFCSRPLPESGACACKVWKRTPVQSPTYLIELTPEHKDLVNKEGYWSAQYAAAKDEKTEHLLQMSRKGRVA